jgi:hypothetical protein
MSADQFVASLSADAGRFFFALAVTSVGKVPDVRVLEQEELGDPGIDDVRYRDLYARFPEFTMDTLEDFTDQGAGLTLERSYRSAIGSVATLTQILTTVTTSFRVKIRSVDPVVRAGPLIGFGASAGSIGTIRARWTLRVVESFA